MRLIDALGLPTASGASVNENSASTVATVTGCVGILADMVGKLPLKLYQKSEEGREEAKDHPAYKLIAIDPGASATPFEFRRQVQTGVGFGGNGYARVHRDQYYMPAELEWLKPCDVRADKFKREIIYKIENEQGVFTRADIIHVRGLSSDGIYGMSPVRLMRESIGLSLTQRDQAGKIYQNGARFPGYFVTPTTLQPKQLTDFRTELDRMHVGAANTGRQPVLWGGFDYKSVNGMTMADAEFLESRKFERTEIATYYRIPEVLFGNSDKASSWGTGIETLTNGFLTFCLDPWLVNWEQSLNYTLLTSAEQASGYYFKFNRRALLAVALESQANFLQTMRNIGVYNVDECRAYLEENKLMDRNGEDYMQPFNGSGGRPAEAPKTKEEPADV